jgi:hypothetical protein
MIEWANPLCRVSDVEIKTVSWKEPRNLFSSGKRFCRQTKLSQIKQKIFKETKKKIQIFPIDFKNS